MTPAELIAALEAADGPSRELDCHIWVAVFGKGRPMITLGPPTYSDVRYFCNPDAEIKWLGYDLLNMAPSYTSSLDAALTLVPEGWTVAGIGQDDNKLWHSELREGYLTSYTRVVFGPSNYKAVTPAIALCIAALMARA